MSKYLIKLLIIIILALCITAFKDPSSQNYSETDIAIHQVSKSFQLVQKGRVSRPRPGPPHSISPNRGDYKQRKDLRKVPPNSPEQSWQTRSPAAQRFVDDVRKAQEREETLKIRPKKDAQVNQKSLWVPEQLKELDKPSDSTGSLGPQP